MRESVYKNYGEAKVLGVSRGAARGQPHGGTERKVHSVGGGEYRRCYMKFQQWPKRVFGPS